MYCSRCGSKLMNNAFFCSNCGEKVGVDTNLEPRSPSVASKELERDALKIYLGDVLALECIVNQFSEKVSNQTNEIESRIHSNYYQRYSIDQNYSFQFLYVSDIYYVLTTNNGYEIAKWSHYKNIWTPVEDILQNISKRYTWDSFIGCGRGFFESRIRQKELTEQFLSNYADFKQKAPTEYEKNIKIISKLKEENELVCKEWNEAKELLQRLYQINIIPESFRNDLYAIYYLHNFVTTSNLSFETALLHYNLDEIKAKLDKIIVQQEEIIIATVARESASQ